MHQPEPLTFPQEYIQRLLSIVPSEVFTQIMAAQSIKRPTTFRVNTILSTSDAVQHSLKQQGFILESVPWYPDAFILLNRSLRELTETLQYSKGELYVQSLSSMIPPHVLNPQPGDKVLDITAAPGSKTTQMASMMHNIGELIANDSSRVRGYRLAANIKLQGATIAKVTQYDARSVWQHQPEYYDKALVDVPCSMEGRFITTDPKTFNDWSLKKIKELSRLQRWILRSAISSTKPGGTIVYSTCTLSPEENEEVINWILDKEKDKIMVEDIHLEGLYTNPALRSFGEKIYDMNIGKTVRIYPTDRMEGFYIAKLKKLKSSIPEVMRR